jgi:hypothetical protein
LLTFEGYLFTVFGCGHLSATYVTSWQPGRLLNSSATASNNSGAGSNIQFVSDSTAALLIQFGATFMSRRPLFKITVLQDGDIALLVSVSMACWAWTTTLFSTMNSETQEVFTVPHVFLASPRGLSRSPCGVRAFQLGHSDGTRTVRANFSFARTRTGISPNQSACTPCALCRHRKNLQYEGVEHA